MTRRYQFVNVSHYPDHAVRALVDFALGTLDGEWCHRGRPPHRVWIGNTRSRAFRGLGGSCGVKAWIGSPIQFPATTRSTRSYIGWTAADWPEAIVSLVAHEATHVDQCRRGVLSKLPVSSRENEADRASLAALKAYREGGRARVDVAIRAGQLRASNRRHVAEVAADYVASPAGKLDRAREALTRWERKARRVARRLAVLRRRVRYYERTAEAAAAKAGGVTNAAPNAGQGTQSGTDGTGGPGPAAAGRP